MKYRAGTRVAIIGAGPYGVAIAAHLQFHRIGARIFGFPMWRWLSQMPKSMILKSEACASSLSDPAGRYTLAEYCRDNRMAYSPYAVPLSRENFAGYALWFQQKLVPHVENVLVTMLRKHPSGFEISLDNGETLQAENVILASGLDHMTYIPAELSHLPHELCSHSADHHDFSGFRGKEVAVVGGGQSGLESAAILAEEGASVNLLVRAPTVAWNRVPSTKHRSRYQRFRRPRSRLGEGLKTWVWDRAPQVFHCLPRATRMSVVKTTLGPAGAWWLKERVVGKARVLLSHRICAAAARGGRVVLSVDDQQGRRTELNVDHVIASTGYRYDLRRLPLLSGDLCSEIANDGGAPRLSSKFESSVRGLYFSSLASANSFGPVMRFLAGTDFTARTIASHLARRLDVRRAGLAPAPTCAEE